MSRVFEYVRNGLIPAVCAAIKKNFKWVLWVAGGCLSLMSGKRYGQFWLVTSVWYIASSLFCWILYQEYVGWKRANPLPGEYLTDAYWEAVDKAEKEYEEAMAVALKDHEILLQQEAS